MINKEIDRLKEVLIENKKPSEYFETLRAEGRLSEYYTELGDLIGVQQNPKFHPEGDVWVHTMMVIDSAAGLRDKAENPLGFMLAALCHDLGKKVSTTVEPDGRIRSIGHEKTGVPLAGAMLRRIGFDKDIIEYALNIVYYHMKPNLYASQNSSQKAFDKVFSQCVSPNDLLLMAESDRMGRAEGYAEVKEFLRDRFESFLNKNK